MKIVIAMDSFKGTLSADETCGIVADELLRCRPTAEIVIKPMADGGEGTAEVLIKNANGKWLPQTVTGPLTNMQVDAGFAWFETDKTAVVEMAAASGLILLSKQQMNPLKTTTYGTGQLIKATLQYGACKILLAVGGSATVEGGIGAATALGWQFLDKQGNPVTLTGEGLNQIHNIISPQAIDLPPVEVLCDVDNPLCGKYGAAKTYAIQKGATPAMVKQLEQGLENLATLVQKYLSLEIANLPGAGAAGGLAAGAVAFMNGSLVSGIDTVIDRSGLSVDLKDADWVITGEGSFDEQSLHGKVVAGVAKAARKVHTRIAVIAGRVLVAQDEYQKLGITTAIPCQTANMSLDYALKNSRPFLRSATNKFANEYL